MSSTTTLSPPSNSSAAFYYLVETTGKHRRYIRGIYDTLVEAEQHKSRIKARWQPIIVPVHRGPYKMKWVWLDKKKPKDEAEMWPIVATALPQMEEERKAKERITPPVAK